MGDPYQNLKCSNCGGNLVIKDDIFVCNSCGSTFKQKQIDSKLFVNLELAQNERQCANFSKAKDILNKIIKDFPEEDLSDVYWNLLLCDQNVMLEEDGKGEKFPSFFAINSKSILYSEEYKKAIEYADKFDNNKHIIFGDLASKIENAKSKFFDISSKNKPYDIFICFKKSDSEGKTTQDTQLALDIYNELSRDYKIFFSEKSLANIKSVYRDYEPNIYYGLYTAKVMLLICSKKEYLESTWLKNEWKRFSKLNNKTQTNNCIIPIFMNNFNPNDLPNDLWHTQGLFADIKLIANLKTQLESIINPIDELEILKKQQEELKRQQEEILRRQQEENDKKINELKQSLTSQKQNHFSNNNQIASYEKRANIFLEDGDYLSADHYAEKILDINPEYAPSYIIKLLARLKKKNIETLINEMVNIEDEPEFSKALKFADDDYKIYLNNTVNEIKNNILSINKVSIYNKAKNLFENEKYQEAIKEYSKITEFKDSQNQIEICNDFINKRRQDRVYQSALYLIKQERFLQAFEHFESISNYKDSKNMVLFCQNKLFEQLMVASLSGNIELTNDILLFFKKRNYEYESIETIYLNLYNYAIKIKNDTNFKDALKIFEYLGQYSDSLVQVEDCKRLNSIKEQEKIYLNALDRLKAKKLNAKMFEKSIEDMNSIKTYKDAFDQISKIKNKLKKWKNQQLIKISLITITISMMALLCSLTALTLNYFIPNSKYKKAIALYETGNYQESMSLLEEIGNFKNSRKIYLITSVSNKFMEENISSYDIEYNLKKLIDSKIDFNVTTIINSSEKKYNNNFPNSISQNSNEYGYEYLWNLKEQSIENLTNKLTYNFSIIGTKQLINYSITYNLNGGTNDEQNPSNYNVETNTIVLKKATKPGYLFEGWYKESYFEERISYIQKSSKGDLNIYAKYSAVSYAINYELNGGRNNSNNPSTYSIESQTINLLKASKLGYTFENWYKESDFVNIVTQIPTGSYGKIDLYAKFLPISYKIFYNLDGGTNSNLNPSSFNIESKAIILENATKPGYDFVGWYLETNFLNILSIINKGSMGNITLFAKYRVVDYAIIYHLDGGTNNTNNLSKYNIESENITLYKPTKKGYSFVGWYKDSNYEILTKSINTGNYGNIHLYAKWEIISFVKENNDIYFGSYPQTSVTSLTLINALNKASNPLPNGTNETEWIDYGYYIDGRIESFMYYQDLEYNNLKYRGVYFEKYRSSETTLDSQSNFQSENGYIKNTIYWFKYEPIKWNILKIENNFATIVCDSIIDAQSFNQTKSSSTQSGKAIYSNNYEFSYIRNWLNLTFYKTAFSDFQKSLIKPTIVDNSITSTGYTTNNYACKDTIDNIFLLSYKEVSNTYYNAGGQLLHNGSDYAKSQGLEVFNDSLIKFSNYFLRSPSNSLDYGVRILYQNGICSVNSTCLGVLPTLVLNLGEKDFDEEYNSNMSDELNNNENIYNEMLDEIKNNYEQYSNYYEQNDIKKWLNINILYNTFSKFSRNFNNSKNDR